MGWTPAPAINEITFLSTNCGTEFRGSLQAREAPHLNDGYLGAKLCYGNTILNVEILNTARIKDASVRWTEIYLKA
jgi:hypothetical protein